MTKATVSRIWVVGLVLVLLGILVSIIGIAMAGPTIDRGDLNNTQYLLTEMSRTTGGIIGIIGLVAVAIGGLLQFVAWILAIVVSAIMNRWVWFVALLVLGVVGLEFFVMLAYVIAGPTESRSSGALTPA